MVSGLVTSPCDFCKIDSGDARPILILVKLLFCMVLVLVYLLKFKVNDIIFVANFISLYFLFTAFEVYALLCNLRHQNKDPKNTY